jgi:hypothetical protein
MPTFVAALVYLSGMGLPILLLYRFHSQSWYWHVLAMLGAIALGLLPIPADLQRPGFDLVFGFVFIFLMVWGGGGLLLPAAHHREKHA